MNIDVARANDIFYTIPLIAIFVLLIVAAIFLFKEIIFVGEKPYVYLFPLWVKKMDYPVMRKIFFFICLGIVAMAGYLAKANAFACILFLIILNWLLYIAIYSFITLLSFAAGMKIMTWVALFIMPVASALSMFFIKNIIELKYARLVTLLFELFATISLLGTYCLMFSIATNRNNCLEKNSESEGNNVLIAEIYLIFVQIAIFWVMLAELVMMGAAVVIDSRGNEVDNLLDIFYYVIMTYTTVGYGDLQPAGNLGKILSCVISMTGFVTSVCVIGLLVGNMSGITSANENSVHEDFLPDNTTVSNCDDLIQ